MLAIIEDKMDTVVSIKGIEEKITQIGEKGFKHQVLRLTKEYNRQREGYLE